MRRSASAERCVVLGDPLLLRRLAAYVQRRAVRTHTHTRIAVRPHALVCAAVALSGEDSSLHAIQLGWPGRSASLKRVVPDPRQREHMDAMFACLGAHLERYLDRCAERGVAPQLVVTSPSALRHLTNIADDFRFLERNPAVARLALLLTYFTERAQVVGQQAVVVMTEALTTNWVTPMQPSQEFHLAAVLACIDPPPGTDLEASIREAEHVPMGASTDPAFDNQILAPLLGRYHRARRRGPVEDLAVVEREIADALAPIVGRMYAAMQHGLTILARAELPPLSAVIEWARQEQRHFLDYRRALLAGVRFPLSDRPKLAAFRLVQREDALANHDAAVVCEDSFGRARSVCTGQALAGIVQNPRRERPTGRRRVVHVFDVLSAQDDLTLREHDEIRWADDPRLTCTVIDCRLEGGATRVTLTVTGGMNVPGMPEDGMSVTFVRSIPDWHRIGRRRAAMAARLAILPWTHTAGELPDAGPAEVPPDDPIQALEVLR